jgi:hypothetical protein
MGYDVPGRVARWDQALVPENNYAAAVAVSRSVTCNLHLRLQQLEYWVGK